MPGALASRAHDTSAPGEPWTCQRTVAYRPGTLSEALTEHYRRAHPEALGLPAQ